METIVVIGFAMIVTGLVFLSSQLKRIEFLLQKLVDDKDPNQWPPSN